MHMLCACYILFCHVGLSMPLIVTVSPPVTPPTVTISRKIEEKSCNVTPKSKDNVGESVGKRKRSCPSLVSVNTTQDKDNVCESVEKRKRGHPPKRSIASVNTTPEVIGKVMREDKAINKDKVMSDKGVISNEKASEVQVENKRGCALKRNFKATTEVKEIKITDQDSSIGKVTNQNANNGNDSMNNISFVEPVPIVTTATVKKKKLKRISFKMETKLLPLGSKTTPSSCNKTMPLVSDDTLVHNVEKTSTSVKISNDSTHYTLADGSVPNDNDPVHEPSTDNSTLTNNGPAQDTPTNDSTHKPLIDNSTCNDINNDFVQDIPTNSGGDVTCVDPPIKDDTPTNGNSADTPTNYNNDTVDAPTDYDDDDDDSYIDNEDVISLLAEDTFAQSTTHSSLEETKPPIENNFKKHQVSSWVAEQQFHRPLLITSTATPTHSGRIVEEQLSCASHMINRGQLSQAPPPLFTKRGIPISLDVQLVSILCMYIYVYINYHCV